VDFLDHVSNIFSGLKDQFWLAVFKKCPQKGYAYANYNCVINLDRGSIQNLNQPACGASSVATNSH
jgi:hypothetical protein